MYKDIPKVKITAYHVCYLILTGYMKTWFYGYSLSKVRFWPKLCYRRHLVLGTQSSPTKCTKFVRPPQCHVGMLKFTLMLCAPLHLPPFGLFPKPGPFLASPFGSVPHKEQGLLLRSPLASYLISRLTGEAFQTLKFEANLPPLHHSI